MADTNKIKYGIKNVTFFPATIANDGTATYGTAISVPGAVSLSLDQQGEPNKFYADNIVYYTSVSNNGYEGDLELAMIPEAVLTGILGYFADANGVLVEDANAPVKHFAMAFQFEGDKHDRRHILYNCTMNRPSVAGSTKEESIEPQTETVTIIATSIYNDDLKKDIVKASCIKADSATAYADWFTTAYQPEAATT